MRRSRLISGIRSSRRLRKSRLRHVRWSCSMKGWSISWLSRTRSSKAGWRAESHHGKAQRRSSRWYRSMLRQTAKSRSLTIFKCQLRRNHPYLVVGQPGQITKAGIVSWPRKTRKIISQSRGIIELLHDQDQIWNNPTLTQSQSFGQAAHELLYRRANTPMDS